MAVRTADGPELLTETEKLASGKNFAAVATVLPTGRIQNQLIWVGLEDGKLILNTETHRVKHLNVKRDNRISVVIRNEDDPYCYAEVRGTVTAVTTGDRARTQIDELADKYLGKPYPPEAIKSERVILWITPQRQTFIDQNNGIAD